MICIASQGLKMVEIKVNAFWDIEAKVWVANGENIRGLVTEAPSLDLLAKKLKVMIPELLQLNH